MRLQGLTLPQIAQQLDLPPHAVHYHMRAPEEYAQTERMIRSIVLAAELRIDPANLRKAIVALGIPATTYGRHMMLTSQDAQLLRDHYAGHIDVQTSKGWWTIEQVARALHVSTETVRKQRKAGVEPYASIRRARVLGASGNVYRYDPYTVHPIAANLPVQPLTTPRGSLTSREIAEALGLNPTSVNAWAQRNPDAPARQTQHGGYYWPLPALLDWLASRTSPHMQGYGRHLSEQRVAS